jgi:type IV secretory pathway protease TraF
MLPALRPGQVVVAVRQRKAHAGYVVIFSHDGLEKIKRVALVSSGGIYMLGDNATASTDSRQFGDVPHAQLIAKVIWPRTTLPRNN